MKALISVLVSVLAIVLLAGCSDTETPAQNVAENNGNDPEARTDLPPTEQLESTSDSPQARTELSPKEQYVVDARQLVDNIFEIVDGVSDEESAAKALEECTKLKPVAEELGETARKMMEAVRDDPGARTELVQYFQSECHSDAELQPLVSKIGESKKQSKYPQLFSIVVELLETSMHNHF